MKMRYTASSIPSLKGRTFFFDTNSLIYIFWSTSPDSQEAVDYCSIYATLVRNNATLAINEIVISEIVNRVLRIEFSKTGMSKDKFKEFRDSADGHSVQEDIYAIIKDKKIPSCIVLKIVLQSMPVQGIEVSGERRVGQV